VTRLVRPAAALAAVVALAGCATGSGFATSGSATDASRPTDAAASFATTTVTVFVAASLAGAFDELAERFEAEYPLIEIVLNSGGSAALAQQIVQGAPADAFASAAEPPMQAVLDAGLARDAAILATNTLELVTPAGNPAGITGLDDLARPELQVALCDVSVPCGAASARLLERQGVAASADTLESDVTAVLTKVVLGEVDAALVYRTEVIAAAGAVEGIEVPGAASVVNRAPIAVMTDAADPAAAADFVAFATGADGRAVLDAAGFGAP
jgi:molybdate transport system substrate-binding protein